MVKLSVLIMNIILKSHGLISYVLKAIETSQKDFL